jgi:hypothetical protein
VSRKIHGVHQVDSREQLFEWSPCTSVLGETVQKADGCARTRSLDTERTRFLRAVRFAIGHER